MKNSYPNIDMKVTGRMIGYYLKRSGYSVKDLQKYLKLEGPQSIYRWMQGKTLPSLDHLYAIAGFLDVKIDDILVGKSTGIVNLLPDFEYNEKDLCSYMQRLHAYNKDRFLMA